MLKHTSHSSAKSHGNKPKINKVVLKQLISYYKPYKRNFFIVFILAILAGFATAASVCVTGIIYSKLDFSQANPLIISVSAFGFICLGLFACYLISSFFSWLSYFLTVRSSENATYCLRKDVFEHLQHLPVAYFDRTPSGTLMGAVSNDIDNISQAVSQYFANILVWFFTITFVLIAMFISSWALTLITLLIIPLILLMNLFIVKKIRPYFTKQQTSIADLNGFVEEMVSGTKIVSLFKMQKETAADFDKINNELTKNSIVAMASSNIMMPLNAFLNNIGFVIICLVGVPLIVLGLVPTNNIFLQDIANPATASWSLLITFTMFVRNLTNPINQIFASSSVVFMAVAGAERIFNILKQIPEADKADAINLKKVEGKVEFKGLTFGYTKDKMILKNLNFVAKPGEMTAIVGPTGAGKTTIVNLITKFYDLNSGKLLIDDISIDDINRDSLRKNITMVLQDSFLFGESIYKNINYGRHGATKNEIIAAAKKANAHNFIMQMPGGYNAILEDNGSNLSQGQRQLLAIARAFLADTKIVILDEATSSIDTKTELEISKAMDDLVKNKTSFVIAHRLSTIQNANTILVLKDGEIVERGNHKELLDKDGFYAKLYNTQFKNGAQI